MLAFNFVEFFLTVCLWAEMSLCNNLPLEAKDGLSSRPTSGELLARQLSSGARVYYPGSVEFYNSTLRWSTLEAPTFRMTVEVATEGDVLQVVRYANKHNIPFIPVNNAHGAMITVGKVQNGIMIWMRQLNSFKIAEDGRTATFGGGIIDKAVTDGLWAVGKQTVTGGCECVSVVTPGLGGGHGFLQARYGLVSDQFVSLNMVMADGTLQTVNHTHELWWAVRGAGHNFGIVTSITSKIYDVKFPKWSRQSFIFTSDKIEALYVTINEQLLKNGTQPIDIFSFSFWSKNPAIDPVNVVVTFHILQEGTEIVDEALVSSFLDLGPIASSNGSGYYPDIPGWIGWAKATPTCQNAGFQATTRFPLELQKFDISAQRRVYELFNSTVNEIPAFAMSGFLWEGYSQQGVKSMPSENSAYPFRGSNLLVAPVIRFTEDNGELVKKAEKLGEALRGILHEASGQKERRVYINYALGTESMKEIYGDEEWRQEKLVALKKKYDPAGKFSYYAPIV